MHRYSQICKDMAYTICTDIVYAKIFGMWPDMDKCQQLPSRLVTKGRNPEVLPRAAAVAVAVTQICSDMHKTLVRYAQI